MKKLFGSRNSDSVRPSSLRVEALEDRQMLSVTDVAALALASDNAVEVAAAPEEVAAIDLSAVESSAVNVDQLVDTVQNIAVDTVIANVSVEGLEGDVTYKVSVDGANSKAFEVQDGQLVYVSKVAITPETPYSVVVTASNGEESVSSEAISLTVFGKMEKAKVTTELNGDSISVDWQDYPYASRYWVEYKTEADSAFTRVVTTESEAVLENLEGNEVYTIRVKALGDSAYNTLNSDYVYATVSTSAPVVNIVSAVEAIDYREVGGVVATFTVENCDNPAYVVLDNGVPTENFAVEGDAIVLVGDVLHEAQPHDLQLVVVDEVTGLGGESEVISVAITGKLDKTVVTVDSVTDTTASISWTPVENACAYSIQYVKGNGKNFTVVEVPADQLSYTIEGLDQNTDYRVRVKGVAKESGIIADGFYVAFTTEETVFVKLAKPVVNPTDVTVDGSVASAFVTWKAVENASAYSVQYSLNSSKTFTVVEVSADQLSYTIEGLQAGKDYKVRVRALGTGRYTDSDAGYDYFSTVADNDVEEDDLANFLAEALLA